MPLRDASLEAIQQALDIISVAGGAYSKKLNADLQPIGTHVRHIVDHYWAFQHGLAEGSIDYNRRNREAAIEREPVLAIKALKEIYTWFENQPLENVRIDVISEISISHIETAKIDSCTDRELIYLINHTLHHVAYANLLATSLGIKTHAHLGVAPATASYLREQEKVECAR